MTYLCALKFKKEVCLNPAKGMATLNMFVIAGIVVALGIFLFENDSLVAKSYQIRDYETQLKASQALAKSMEIKKTEQGSLIKLQAAAQELNLVSADKVKYLQAAQSSVALVNRTNP